MKSADYKMSTGKSYQNHQVTASSFTIISSILDHRVSVEDLKREHEADRQHLIRMHCDEVEALKAAHSHTRYVYLMTACSVSYS